MYGRTVGTQLMTTPYSDAGMAYGPDTPNPRVGRAAASVPDRSAGDLNHPDDPIPSGDPAHPEARMDGSEPPGMSARRGDPDAPSRKTGRTRSKARRAVLEDDLDALDATAFESDLVDEDEGPIVVMAPRPWSPPATILPALLLLLLAVGLMAYRAMAVSDWQGLIAEGRSLLFARNDAPANQAQVGSTATVPDDSDKVSAVAGVTEPPALVPPRDVTPEPAPPAVVKTPPMVEPAPSIVDRQPPMSEPAPPIVASTPPPPEPMPPAPEPILPAPELTPPSPANAALEAEREAVAKANTLPEPADRADAVSPAAPPDERTAAALDDIQREADRRRAEQEELSKLRKQAEANAPPPRRAMPGFGFGRPDNQQMMALMRELQTQHLEMMDRMLRQMEGGLGQGGDPVFGGLAAPGQGLGRRQAEALQRANRDLQRLRDRMARGGAPGLAGGALPAIPPPPQPGGDVQAFSVPGGGGGFILRWGFPPQGGGN